MITVNTILDVALLFQLVLLEIRFGKLFHIIHKVGDQITTKMLLKGSQYKVESLQFDNGDCLYLKNLDDQQHYI